MSTDRKTRVRDAFAAFGRGDPSVFLEQLAPDVTYTLIGDTAVSGVRRGREAVTRGIFAPLGGALAGPLVLEVDSATGEGDRLALQVHGTSRLRSGVRYDNTYAFVLRFAGDHVAEVTEYLDTALVNRAFAVPVERAALLRAMDLNMWEMFRDIVRIGRGGELIETGGFTMCASPHGTSFHNMTMVRDTIAVDELLAAVREFYGRGARPFSIWTRAHADAALEAELQARGFMQLVAMPAMALLDDPGTVCAPEGLRIRPVRDDQGRRDFLAVTAEAYATFQQPQALTDDAFAALESVCAPHLQGFLGYLDGSAVAAAAVYVTHGIAGIGWVGTVSAHRGRRYAEAVTWAAVREGFRRGAAFANLQASPMGRPVYERMGFITPSEYRVWVGTL